MDADDSECMTWSLTLNEVVTEDVDMNEVELLRKKLDREKRARSAAEDIAEIRLREAYTANRQLLEAQSELSQANEELNKSLAVKQRFLQIVSHELLTPLNGIIGMAELLKLNVDDSNKTYLELLMRCSSDLLEMVNNILFYSEASSGSILPKAVKVNLNNWKAELLEVFLPKVKGDLSFQISVDEALPEHLFFDAELTKKVLKQLLENANKFTPAGSIHIHLCGERVDEQHFSLCFEVTDTGVGIANATIEELIGLFSQQDETTTRAYGGLGLGLTLSQAVLALMGSELSVKENDPRGTVFSFKLLCRE